MSEFEAEKTATGKSPCDCGCGDCGDKAKPAVVEAQPDNSRRKLLFGGVIATPAIVMLSSRSALATGTNFGAQCTASAHASINLSKPQVTNCKSLSPGCWKNTMNWPSPFKPGLPNPIDGSWTTIPTATDLKNFFKNTAKCTNSDTTALNMAAKWQALAAQATLCQSYFPWATPSSKTFQQALIDNSNQLLRKSVCCVLNAAQFGQQAFGYTVAEIVALINQRVQANDPTLLNDLDYLSNVRGSASCPSDGCGSINWCQVCAA
jgi:hypothetical protein